MRLSEFILEHRERIVSEWVAFARTCVPMEDQMDLRMLRDHASEMLDAIAVDLNQPQSKWEEADKAAGRSDALLSAVTDTAAQSHGEGRAKSGFDVAQMVAEYRALRASVIRLWLDEVVELDSTHVHDLVRFNESIDQALAESTARYAQYAEAAVRQARDTLEVRVSERTHELAQTNELLRNEMTQRKQSEALRMRLLAQLVQAQENERGRISREMHDQLGQQITALSLKVSALKNAKDASSSLQHELNAIESIARQLDGDVEFLVWQLRPTALDDLGLLEALSEYVETWSRHFGVPAQLHTRGMEQVRLPGDIETVLYRVTQEALNNVAKHARAGHVNVVLEHRPDQTSLIVADDGVGFEMEPRLMDTRKGLGIVGIQERVSLVGGIATVEARPGEGTTLFIQIPTDGALAAAGPAPG